MASQRADSVVHDRSPAFEQRRNHGLAVLTDLCVKCGLCAPHCPTYKLTGQEGESPRGRISLIQGLASEQIPPSEKLVEHLGNCLGCRTCESVCPAQVPFGEIIDAGRAELRKRGQRSPASVRLLGAMSTRSTLRALSSGLLKLAKSMRVDRLLKRFGDRNRHWALRAARLSPGTVPVLPLGKTYAAARGPRGEVDLFVGCIARAIDSDTHAATVRVLSELGFSVRIPDKQTCCGALHQHDGYGDIATHHADQNCRAFGDGDKPVLTTATGCASTLIEYDRIAGDPGGGAFANRVRDVSGFLLDNAALLRPLLKPLRVRVAVHSPCSARNVDGIDDVADRLLELIPGIEVIKMESVRCCGAAGHHFLTRGRQADALLAPLLAEMEELSPEFVATSNPGCAQHMVGGLLESGHGPEVVHPIILIARSMTASR